MTMAKSANTLTIHSPVDVSKRKLLDVRSGDTIRVWQKIQEEDKKTGKIKTRLQAFEGLVIAVKHGREAGATFTVRRVASGVGVEKIFPLYSPLIYEIEMVKRSKTRKSKLYYVREKAAKEVRRKMKHAHVAINKDGVTIPAAAEVAEEAAAK